MSNTLLLRIVMFMFCAISANAQTSNTSTVASVSYKGMLAIGIPLVGRIQNPASHGWWSWRILPSAASSTPAFAKPLMPLQSTSSREVMVGADVSYDQITVVDNMGQNIGPASYHVDDAGTITLSNVPCGVYHIVVRQGSTTRLHHVLIVQ